MKKLTLPLVASLLAVGLAYGLTLIQNKKQNVFVLSSVEGKSVDIAGLRGKVVVLSFGATWCPPCREELPVLQELSEKYKTRPVEFYWVSIDEKDVANDQLKQFVSEAQLRVTVLRDPDADLLLHFKTEGVPAMILLDTSGKIVGEPHVGYAGREIYLDQMTKLIDSVLKKP
jgi:thiol-disulfide isomerase/thioredoxin